jgi:hypothetical protein
LLSGAPLEILQPVKHDLDPGNRTLRFGLAHHEALAVRGDVVLGIISEPRQWCPTLSAR